MRQKSKSEVSHFLDDEIGTKLKKLNRQVARIDSRLFTYHEVDLASGYKDTEKLIDELMKIQIPRYKPSSNHVELSTLGKLHYLVKTVKDRTTNSGENQLSITK